MNSKDLKRANELHKEIQELDSFIRSAQNVWTGKLNLKKIISNGYGVFKSKEYSMNTEIKDKVLDVLIKHLAKLTKELNEM